MPAPCIAGCCNISAACAKMDSANPGLTAKELSTVRFVGKLLRGMDLYFRPPITHITPMQQSFKLIRWTYYEAAPGAIYKCF